MAPRDPSELDPAVAARLKHDDAGLVAAVVQQHDTGEVLMLAWMDDEALHRTLTTGRATYWSRSRREYWVKGEMSGNSQHVRSVALDCDGDALLLRVEQTGPACHTGDRTCFDADELAVSVPPPGEHNVTAPLGRADLDRLAHTHRLVPITRTLFADAETPVGVYRKLAAGRPGTFLLESAEPGASFSRWSFVGVHARACLSVRDNEASWTGEAPSGVPMDGDPLAALGAAWRAMKGPRLPGLPPLTGGFVGYLGYDVVRRIEKLPDQAVDELGLPELTMLLVTDLAAVDHHECTVVLIANAVIDPTMTGVELDLAYADAVRRLDEMQAGLATPTPPTVATISVAPPKAARSRTPEGEYEPAVERALEAVRAGEVFQIQVGQRFVAETDADPLDVYRVLRTLNPSPYMYFLRTDDVDVVGCSPEALVTVSGDRAVLHPIAGTRKRGETAERDAALAAELVSDPKEQAEHIMLVDLARNDLGRVSAPGSVEVVEFGAVERYSHVWHIVSTVESRVADGMDAFDVLTATFPAGTLTGAPKVRAMELIDELEPVRRNIYGGAVGYLDAAGDLDMAIAIRTAVMRDGVAYVQAAAGVVADSVPALEEQETRNKARAVLQAIATAETLRTVT